MAYHSGVAGVLMVVLRYSRHSYGYTFHCIVQLPYNTLFSELWNGTHVPFFTKGKCKHERR